MEEKKWNKAYYNLRYIVGFVYVHVRDKVKKGRFSVSKIGLWLQ